MTREHAPRPKRLLLLGAVFNRRAHSLSFWNATQRCHLWLRAFNWRSGIARSRARSSLRRSGSSVRSISAASYCVTAWFLSTPQHHRPTPSQPAAARDAVPPWTSWIASSRVATKRHQRSGPH
jgi:hypothetical protein